MCQSHFAVATVDAVIVKTPISLGDLNPALYHA